MSETNATLAYSRTPAPPASRCAWCEHQFDDADDRLAGRTVCTRCGVATTSPWPSDAQLGEAYGDWYRPANGRFSGLGDKLLRRSRSALAGRLHRVLPRGPVLDVGAGDGTLVRAFIRHGREAVGVDPYASANHPHVRDVELEQMDGSWSAVIFWHSLEHLREPVRALRHAATLAAPGGMLVVAVPNAASLQARTFGDRWLHLDVPRHLVHISPPALVSAIEAAGFRVMRVSYLRGGQVVFGWLHGLVGKFFPGHPDLYDAIRRSEARQTAHSPLFRLYTLAAAVITLPAALAATGFEVAARAGGTVYVEARREAGQEPAATA
ncbi:MAG: class I SAM-dependent methyltransferase [Streptosporangiaceae bacterium]